MRILILNNDLMTRQAAMALSVNGHQVTLPESQDSYLLNLKTLQELLDRSSPDFCLMRNRRVLDRGFNPHGLEIDKFLFYNKVPHVCWFTENPLASGTFDSTNYFYCRNDDNCLTLCFSPESARCLQELGHQAEYLPLAATTEWFRHPGLKEIEYLYQVSFIGRPKVTIPPAWNGNKLFHLVHHSLGARQHMTFHHFEREILPRLTQGFLETFETESNLDLQVFRRLARTFSSEITAFLESQLGTHLMFETARLNMLKTIKWLLEAQVDLKLFGGDEWGRIFPQAGETPFVPFQEQGAVYTRSKINLVLSKLELGDVVHERIFNIGACGGFALAEHRDAIFDLFPEGEVPTFRTREELLDKVEKYLRSEKERKEISQAAYKRVMQEHTFPIRMEQMLEKIKNFLAERAKRTFGTRAEQEAASL